MNTTMDVSGQKYKVFLNNVLIEFHSNDGEINPLEFDEVLSLKEVKNNSLFGLWLSQEEPRDILVRCSNLEDDFSEFKKEFKVIEAAGGIVQNVSQEILCIYRNRKWDLPKGKLEKGEEIRNCAEREVLEETGVTAQSEKKIFAVTFHVYFHKSKYVLKPTYWFRMKTTAQSRKLIPQIEEGIEIVEWKNLSNALELFKVNSYRSIQYLISLI